MNMFFSFLLPKTRRYRALYHKKQCLSWPGKAVGWQPRYESSAVDSRVYLQFGGHGYNTLQLQQCRFISSTFFRSTLPESFTSKSIEVMNKMKTQIVSKENITPASPTPHHLRTYKISLLDQVAPSFYSPLILFHLNNQSANLDSVISDRSKNLKRSLSEALTRFYPFAGKLSNDDLHIDCNDEGAYYVETRVNCGLSSFLSQPLDDQMIKQLIPKNVSESLSGRYVIMIQVNYFSCGGTAITISFSHKIIDGSSYIMFLEAWTAASRCSTDIIYPSLIGSSLFPQIPSLYIPRNMGSQNKPITRRFIFDAPTLDMLKAKVRLSSSGKKPTRVEVVAALTWKCATKAAQMPFDLDMLVNLRGKNNLPKYLVGNYFWHAVAKCNLNDPNLQNWVDLVHKGKTYIDNNLVETFTKCETETFKKFLELVKNFREANICLMLTSTCKAGIYELDFGWGKPTWFYYYNPGRVNFIVLNDTRSGDGIEAMVTLSEQDMAIFEEDEELRSFASLNLAPL